MSDSMKDHMKKQMFEATEIYIVTGKTPSRHIKQRYGDYFEKFKWISFDICNVCDTTEKNEVKELNRLHKNMMRQKKLRLIEK